MSITLKKLDAAIFKKTQQMKKRKTMTERIKIAGFMRHKMTCEHCKSMFDAVMEVKAFSAASKETENLMSSLLSKSLH